MNLVYQLTIGYIYLVVAALALLWWRKIARAFWDSWHK